MADLALLQTYLRDPIRIGIDASGTAEANTMITEEPSDIDCIIDLYDNDGIVTLSQNVKKPAGTIPNSNRVLPVPNPAP